VNGSRKSNSAPNAPHLPTPDELVEAPELAILHALDQILSLAPRVLVTAHPELADEAAPFWVVEASKITKTAAGIVADAHRLQRLIRAYRSAASLTRNQRSEVDPEIPF
jgi:hypothetical protein